MDFGGFVEKNLEMRMDGRMSAVMIMTVLRCLVLPGVLFPVGEIAIEYLFLDKNKRD